MAETILFTVTGGYQYWTVPAGVTSVTVAVNGGGSGSRLGGRVEGKLAVTPGKKLCIIVGEFGKANSGTTGGGTAFGAGGAGGNGKSNNGGDGGGGYSAIRLDSSSGTIKCIAGGAGGTSGDGGIGGLGGASTGGSGGRGSSGSNSTGNATGGTQSQGGNGGTSSSGSDFNGSNASDTVVSRGGAGGAANNYSHGGGGGGGGYRSGGGGQASSAGFAPGGGGGGGSNYTGGLTGATSQQGASTTSNGAVRLTWTKPAPANQPPSPPTSAQVNGVAESEGMATRATSTVNVSAIITDPDTDDTVRLLVRISGDTNFSSGYYDYYSGYVSRGSRASYQVPNLKVNTHYYVRLYTQDSHGLFSTTYNALNFWTNRFPNAPVLVAPADNVSIPSLNSVIFSWTFSDPDPGELQRFWQLRYREAATATAAAGPWTTIMGTPPNTWTVNPGTFKGNRFYEWTARTQDAAGWGEWAASRSFYVTSVSTPPILISPKGNAVDVNNSYLFRWQFVDPDPGDVQRKADFRYRIKGQDDTAWVTILGAIAPDAPGSTQAWSIPGGTFVAGYEYEWEVRTYDTIGAALPSDWSSPLTFRGINTPGSGAVQPPVGDLSIIQGALGCGEYRAFVYRQGGDVLLGEIEPLASINFSRVRDDISQCVLVTNGFSADCCELLASLRSWLMEIVLFRDGVRVWEGPITRIAYQADSVEIEAKDVMAYLYRRIMRQGYDDSYRTVPGPDAAHPIVLPTPTSVDRAALLIIDTLAGYDPNVLPYLTVFSFPDDAKESRVVFDYSQTVWEQVDSLAATAGLDYTVVGRRIILWDTHRAIGRLPEMGDGDFSDPPIVTEYGMQLCNYMAVTNNSGIWGAATPRGQTEDFQSYGPIEMVVSAYSDAEGASNEVLTSADRTKLINDLASQARRNIDDRWPTPVIVRVPDNSTLNPDINVGFDQLVPGVWIPLRSASTCREVEQWQKLDSVTVSYIAGVERVSVVMSPAPNGGDDDPDADFAEQDAGG